MKYPVLALALCCLIACKEKSSQKVTSPLVEVILTDTIPFEQVMPFDTIFPLENAEFERTQSLEIKRKELVEKQDDQSELEEVVIHKTFLKDEDLYIIDFTYPHLNEQVKASYVNFNAYIDNTFLDINQVEASILEDKELLCDTLSIHRFKEQRLTNYKVFNLNDQLLSVLLYQENYYAGTLHPTYRFHCLTYDLETSEFMGYEHFFNEGSEEEMTDIINEVLREMIANADLYDDCWELTSDQVFEHKNNFVINDYKVEYYFDDCVICPSYTGSFSVEIPLERLLPILKRYQRNPLIL